MGWRESSPKIHKKEGTRWHKQDRPGSRDRLEAIHIQPPRLHKSILSACVFQDKLYMNNWGITLPSLYFRGNSVHSGLISFQADMCQS